MKRPDRNINIFSMSALDLFASAMGTFVLMAIILYPYYQNNAKIMLQLTTVKRTLAKSEADARRLRRENKSLKAANTRLRRQSEDLRRRVAQLERQLREARRKTPNTPSPGASSVWNYGGIQFAMHEYPGRGGAKLLVGITVSNSTSLPIRPGDIVMVAYRSGSRVQGDLWGWNRTCFFRSFSHKFTATMSGDGRSMAVSRGYVSLRAPQGSRGPCIVNPGGRKRFSINRVR